MFEEFLIPIHTDTDVMIARQQIRELSQRLGFSKSTTTMVMTAVSEISRNIVCYAQKGEILLKIVEENGKKGLLITATDFGPGIANIDMAMQDGYSSNNSLGIGLPGAKRLVDEFAITSEVGKGTTVTMKKWA